MKYFTINSFVESMKESYESLTRIVLIFNTKSLIDTPYRSKQGMPCLIKLFTKDEDIVMKAEDIISLFDEDFWVSFKLPITFKDSWVAVDINTTPEFNEKIDAMFYNRSIRKVGNKTIKTAMEEFKKISPHNNKQALDGEPFDI